MEGLIIILACMHVLAYEKNTENMKQGNKHFLFTVPLKSKDHNFLNSQYFTASIFWDGQPDS